MTDHDQWEPRRRARRRALQALYQRELTGHTPREIIAQFLETQDFSGVDEAYFIELVKGVDAAEGALVERLQPQLDRDFTKIDTMERLLLMLGAWQLLNDPGTPFQIVLDETTALANRFGSGQSHAYVNAVLDRSVRAWELPGSAIDTTTS